MAVRKVTRVITKKVVREMAEPPVVTVVETGLALAILCLIVGVILLGVSA